MGFIIFSFIIAINFYSNEALSSNINHRRKLLHVQSDTYDVVSTCGGLLTTRLGLISYGIFSSIKAHDRCVWILRYPNATSYDLYVDQLGIPTSVNVATISEGPIKEQLVLEPNSLTTVNSTVVVITYYNGALDTETGKGFFLQYVANSEENLNFPSLSESSETIFLSSGFSHLKYPTRREKYEKNELSLFVIKPELYLSREKFKSTEIAFTKKDLSSQAITLIYTFGANSTGLGPYQWTNLGELFQVMEYDTITNTDLILILFLSGPEGSGTGFHLYSPNHREIL